MSVRRLLSLFTVLVVLTGCASAPKQHEYDASHSKAWNLARAAGFYELKDVEAEDVPQDANPNETSVAGAAAFGGLSYLNAPPGFSPGAAGVMGFLSWLSSGEPEEAASRIVAWVPKTEAATPSAAADLLYARIQEAYTPIPKTVPLPEPYRLNSVVAKDRFIAAVFAGGECAGKDVSWTEDVVDCRLRIQVPSHSGDYLEETIAPESMGGFPAWRYVGWISHGYDDRSRSPGTRYARFPELRMLGKLSGRLPPWSFVYVAPRHTSYQTAAGDYDFLPFPLILHQGDAHYFVSPDA